MRQRPGLLEAGNVRNCRMRAQVQENLLAGRTRMPPSSRCTSMVLGATKCPLPMINSAPLVL